MLLTAKILLTIATLGYSAIPAMFDSNPTHATNPSFPGHARFHIVWQVSSYVYVALLALYLIWTAGAATAPTRAQTSPATSAPLDRTCRIPCTAQRPRIMVLPSPARPISHTSRRRPLEAFTF